MATIVKLAYMLIRDICSFHWTSKVGIALLKLKLYPIRAKNLNIRKVPVNLVVTMATNAPMTNWKIYGWMRHKV